MIAGGAAGVMFAFGLAAIALFGDPGHQQSGVRGALAPAPELQIRAEAAGPDNPAAAPAEDGARAPVTFTGEGEQEPRLAGVSEDFPQGAPRNGATAARPARQGLPPAPVATLTEPGPAGPLPVIGPDGTRPSRAYARPFTGDPNAPTVALVIGGMGLNRAVTEAAIDRLPPEVALSFAPYARDLQSWVDRARAAGHEVLIELPMEPFDYPNNDPGPHTLLADAAWPENERRLLWVLSRVGGYYAAANYLGARFTTAETPMGAVLAELERRGVAYLHDGTGRRATVERAGDGARADWAIADRVLDEDPSPRAVDERLLTLEALALQNGTALGAGFAYPATIEQVAQWAEGLEARGYQLAPPSAVTAMRQARRRTQSAAQ